MTAYDPFRTPDPAFIVAPIEMPGDFRQIDKPIHPWADRKLGYFGDERFVMFYHEPRADSIMWKDAHSYGFGLGGWCFYLEQIMPLIEEYGVDLGTDHSEGTHVLLFDRLRRIGYFVERRRAEAFLS